jgi:hypothetical protein
MIKAAPDSETQDQQRKLLAGGGGDRNHVVETHDDIGDHDDPDRMPEARARGDTVAFLFRDQQLGRDQEQR